MSIAKPETEFTFDDLFEIEGEKKKCIIRAVFEINLRTEFNDLCKGLRKLGLDYDILPVDKDCTYLIECNNGDVHFSKEVKD